MNPPDIGRQCGPCTACCTVMGVDEIGKKGGDRCEHVIDKLYKLSDRAGCGIYESRPQSCRDFKCAWLWLDKLRNMERPDIVGIMLDVNTEQSTVGGAFIAREVRPGAFDEDAGRALLERLAKRVLVLKVRGLRRWLMGPESEVRRVKDKLRIEIK